MKDPANSLGEDRYTHRQINRQTDRQTHTHIVPLITWSFYNEGNKFEEVTATMVYKCALPIHSQAHTHTNLWTKSISGN